VKKIVTLGQLKGGVGKTTVAVHLATMLQELEPNRKIVVADADPFGQATHWLGNSDTHDVQVVPVEATSLKPGLDAIDADIIVLDLPAVTETVLYEAVELSEILLVPICPSPLDVALTHRSLTKALNVNKQYGTKILTLPNKLDRRLFASVELEEIMLSWRGNGKVKVSKASLGYRTAYLTGIRDGVGVNKSARNSEAFHEIKALAIEVLGILGIA